MPNNKVPRKLATQAEFSRFAGVHRSTVTRWVQQGIISRRDDGLLDLHQADRQLSEHYRRPRMFRDSYDHDFHYWRCQKLRFQTENLRVKIGRMKGDLIPLADHQCKLREARQDVLDEVLDKVRLILNEIYDRNPDDFSPSRVDLILGQELRRRLRIY